MIDQSVLTQLDFSNAGVFFLLGLLLSYVGWRATGRARLKRQFETLAGQKELLARANRDLARQREELNKETETLRLQRDALNDSVTDLKRLSDLKEQWAAMLVHDLKNPLSAIMSSARLSGSPASLERILLSARQMNQLVMNILDVQRFEAGKIEPALKDASLYQLANTAADQMRALTEEKRIYLRNRVSPAAYARFDWDLCLRVLANLLSNAVKHTPPEGKVVIEAAEANDDLVEISVSDTGAGVPSDKLETIFEKYDVADQKTAKRERSTGLGLAFCKMAVEAHGGTIRAESPPGKGAIIRFTLPEAAIAPPAFAMEAPAPPPDETREPISEEERKILIPVAECIARFEVFESSDLAECLEKLANHPSAVVCEWKEAAEQAVFNLDETALRGLADAVLRPASAPLGVLVVDEDTFILQHVARELGLAGYRTRTAYNGKQALNVLKQSAPDEIDAVLMDLEMPIMNGAEAARRIRESGQYPGLKIIALTGHAPDFVKDAGELFDGYLTKPVRGEKLLQTIENAARDKNRNAAEPLRASF